MNRIVIAPDELQADGTVCLSDARAAHIREVLRTPIGGELRVGLLDGPIGTARLLADGDEGVRLHVTADGPAPAPWIDLLLAVPRPKVLKRLWSQLAALGVGRIILIGAARVERCYFDTHWIEPEHVLPLLLEGLAQAGTTTLPEVWVRRAFKPFVEDELERHYGGASRLLAHPGPAAAPRPLARLRRGLLAVGPEGGWNDFELALLLRHGFQPYALGPRTLRTDTACIALLGALLAQGVVQDRGAARGGPGSTTKPRRSRR